MPRVHDNLRKVDGILLLDKPTGVTSNAALQQAKRLFKARTAGHTGSLDPLASGMLPICFGKATKLSEYLLTADKHYLVTATLGIKTTTGDAEGEPISECLPPVLPEKQLLKILENFHGAILQTPSMYSAIKYKGQPLYKLARQGITVERTPREVHIYELTLMQQTANTLTLAVRCSKGTYIRTLVEDIGEALGCGAHVSYLRRLGAGSYQPEQMLTFVQLEEIFSQQGLEGLDRLLLPLDSAVQAWPLVRLSASAAYYLQRGEPVLVPRSPVTGSVRLYLNEGNFIGIGEVLPDGKIAPRRLLQSS